jgi:hypothetical protein
MEFEFPLPPVTTPSPLPHFSVLDTPSTSSSFSEAFDISRFSVGVLGRNCASNDSARVHPVFIHSDLHPEKGVFYGSVHDYPVDRLNPVCMGYFNHPEFEAAMLSISAAESMFSNGTGYTEIPHDSEIVGDTLQSRRFSSNIPCTVPAYNRT